MDKFCSLHGRSIYGLVVVTFYVLHARLGKDYQYDSKRVCHYLKKLNSPRLSSTPVLFQQRKYSMTDTIVQCLPQRPTTATEVMVYFFGRKNGGLRTTLAYLVVTRVPFIARPS